MIRGTAKNYKDVLVVCDPNDYNIVLKAIRDNKDDYDFRLHLACKAFALAGSYDALISRYSKKRSMKSFQIF